MQDIDMDPSTSAGNDVRRASSTQTKLVLGPDSPFDLEATVAAYEGRDKIHRLLFIATSCSTLSMPALALALATLKSSTLDTALYESTHAPFEKGLAQLARGESAEEAVRAWYESWTKTGAVEGTIDLGWLDQTSREARSGVERLEVELKGYTTNLIKESIRMGHRDLALFLYRTGDLQGSIRSYTKSREYCTTSQHVLEMCIGVIEVALTMSNYAFVRNYVSKAESSLEAIASSAASTAGANGLAATKARAAPVSMPGMVAPSVSSADAQKEKERLIVLERLGVATGVAALGGGGTSGFEKAALALTSIGRETLDSGASHLIPSADIALYAVITGLATFDRAQLKTRLMENGNLRPMIDLEPWLREVLEAFHDRRFKEGLQLLEKYSARQQLDLHLSTHLPALNSLIISRAILSYFTPYSSVSLVSFADAFGYPLAVLTNAVIDLIGKGAMAGRLDLQSEEGGRLIARKLDGRKEAFGKALREGERIQKRLHSTGLRMKLLKAECLVKPAKGSRA